MPNYLCATCEHCGKYVAVAELPSGYRPEFHPAVLLQLKCPHCDAESSQLACDLLVIEANQAIPRPRESAS